MEESSRKRKSDHLGGKQVAEEESPESRRQEGRSHRECTATPTNGRENKHNIGGEKLKKAEEEEEERVLHEERTHKKARPQDHDQEEGTGKRPSSAVQHVVTAHYDARPNMSRDLREQSPIFHLKSFNNWVKSVMISDYCPRRAATVLDICCGKGGDLQKWNRARLAYLVAADDAEVSLQHARERYNGLRNCAFPALFICADCFHTDLADYVDDKEIPPFDLVSCQFALHYSFETEDRARKLLQNVSARLRPGGRFIGTIPNAYWIVNKIKENKDNGSFGNELYEISFSKGMDSFPAFGAQYVFTLKDAIDTVPEYLVHFGVLEKLALEYGLTLEKKWTFHQFYEEHSRNEHHRNLLYRMKVLNAEGSLSPEEWEVAGIYLAFVFRKQSGERQREAPRHYDHHRGQRSHSRPRATFINAKRTTTEGSASTSSASSSSSSSSSFSSSSSSAKKMPKE